MTFLQLECCLNNINNSTGTNDKKQLLTNYLHDSDFLRMCQLALDPQKHYKMTKLPPPDASRQSKTVTMEQIFDKLEDFAVASGISNVEKQFFSNMVHDAEGEEIVNLILGKDLKCGIGSSTINSVRKGTIPEWPYMRCRSYSQKNISNIRYPAFSQIKADGQHLDIVLDNDGLRFVSRQGNDYNFLGVLDSAAHLLFSTVKSGVFIGEGLVLDDKGNPLPRKTGNGIITKGLKGTITKEEAERIRIVLWEYVPVAGFNTEGGSIIPYSSSFQKVVQACEYNPIFSHIECQIINNQEEAVAHYRSAKERGLEGLVLKNFHGVFQHSNSGSKDQVKMKAVEGEEFEAEFIVTGYKLGKAGTAFEKDLGSLQYSSEDGKITGFVGSGFSHEQRRTFTEENTHGKIMTIRFESLIQDKRNKDEWSLYAPRFIEFREKDAADTLSYVQELVGG